MRDVKMTDVWVNHTKGLDELRIDFDSGRHYSTTFDAGDSRRLVAMKLRQMADTLMHDENR